jgi:hypothetical protein
MYWLTLYRCLVFVLICLDAFRLLFTLTQWAGDATAANLARFLFLTDSSVEESISKQLPDVKMSEVQLSDASLDSALEFVSRAISKDGQKQHLADTTKKAVGILGGRYNDLITLIRGDQTK